MKSFPAAVAGAALFAGVGMDSSGPHPPPLPLIRTSKPIEYPRAAAKLGREGRVLLAFGISERGLATDASVLFADDHSFDPAAIELLSGLRFSIPDNWQASGGRYKRYQLGVVFCIPPSAQSEEFADVSSPIFVMTSRVEGSPVLNPLPATTPEAHGTATPAASGCAGHAKI